MLPDDNLWRRIEGFELDEPEASFTFTQRLARENGWSLEYARAVISEYKKFLYLACTAGHPVTPSEAVDEAWHLHLCYTKSYWYDLCGQVLERPLHHNPTEGGPDETAKFRDWYGRTLEAYHKAFGERAPREIWPTVGERFASPPPMKVDRSTHWVIKKPSWPQRVFHFSRRPKNFKLALAAVLLGMLGGGCATQSSLGPFDLNGPEFLVMYWILLAVCIPLLLRWRSQNQGPDDEAYPRAEPDHDPYLISRLTTDTAERMAQVAVSRLVASGKLELGPKNKLVVVLGSVQPANSIESAIYNRVLSGRNKGSDLTGAIRSQFNSMDDRLRQLGFMMAKESGALLTSQLCLGFGLLLLFGGIKMLIGLDRGKPIVFLCITCVALAVYSAIATFSPSARLTHRGRKYIEYLRKTYPRHRMDFADGDVLVPITVALYGGGVMPPALHSTFPQSSGGGSGSGGGDGGGSGCGGGGCGGCGGGGCGGGG